MAKAISNIDISVILSKLHASCSWHSNLYSIIVFPVSFLKACASKEGEIDSRCAIDFNVN